MLSVTLKSIIKLLYNQTNGNQVIIEAVDEETNIRYDFEIHRRKIQRVIGTSKGDARQEVPDIEMFSLPDHLRVIRMTNNTFVQGSDQPYETNIVHVTFNAQLFVMLCRLIKERALLRIRHEMNIFDAHYIDGKLYYSREDEDHIHLIGTNLYRLNKEMPDYEIVYVDLLPANVTYRTINERYDNAARALGKTLKKTKEGVPLN